MCLKASTPHSLFYEMQNSGKFWKKVMENFLVFCVCVCVGGWGGVCVCVFCFCLFLCVFFCFFFQNVKLTIFVDWIIPQILSFGVVHGTANDTLQLKNGWGMKIFHRKRDLIRVWIFKSVHITIQVTCEHWDLNVYFLCVCLIL